MDVQTVIPAIPRSDWIASEEETALLGTTMARLKCCIPAEKRWVHPHTRHHVVQLLKSIQKENWAPTFQ